MLLVDQRASRQAPRILPRVQCSPNLRTDGDHRDSRIKLKYALAVVLRINDSDEWAIPLHLEHQEEQNFERDIRHTVPYQQQLKTEDRILKSDEHKRAHRDANLEYSLLLRSLFHS